MTRRLLRRVVVLVPAVIVCASASAQRQPSVDTGSIAGTVVTSEGRPLRAVRVSADGGALRSPKTAITGDDGRFLLAAMPAGEFNVTASRVGYVTVNYGQSKLGRSPVAVRVEPAAHVEGLIVRLVRGAAITGTIRDQSGDPMSGVEVGVAWWDMRAGYRRLSLFVTGETDNRGTYRLYGLPAGQYVIVATPRGRLGDTREAAPALDPAILRSGSAAAGALARFFAAVPASEPAAVYAPVFYPGTALETSATVVTVATGEESTGIDLTLPLVSAVTVSGVVTGPGGPSAGLSVTMTFAYSVVGASLTAASTAADGTFRFTRVRPGQYTLTVQSGSVGRGAAASGAEPLWGMASVDVDGRGPVSVSIPLAPGASVSGRIVHDGAPSARSDGPPIQIALRPFVSAAAPTVPFGGRAYGTADAAGLFTVMNVPPGRYFVDASSLGDGQAFVSALVNGQDAADTPIDIGPSERVTDAVVSIATGVSEVAGTVRDARGAPVFDATVVAFPADRAYWLLQSRRIRSVQPNSAGGYMLRNLPAGQYRIAAVSDIEPGAWFDPAVLDALRSLSTTVALGQGEKLRLDLSVGHGRPTALERLRGMALFW